MKKSSAEACLDDSLTQSTLSSLKSLEESKFGAKGRREMSLECARALLDEGWSVMNEWLTVRREESGIYTPRQNLTVQIYIGSPDTDLWNIQRQGNEEL